MQKNDLIELAIEDMGVDGEGIGKYEGMTFFVKRCHHRRCHSGKDPEIEKALWLCQSGGDHYL